MATYAEIEEWIRERYGWRPKTCWIAHCKEIAGLDRRDAPNRRGRDRLVPCPREKRAAIIQAFRHFKMLTHVDRDRHSGAPGRGTGSDSQL